MSSVIRITLSILASLTLLPALAQAGHHEGGDHSVAAEVSGDDVVWASGGRALVAEAEVRAPTAEEEANPWVVLGEMGRTADDDSMTAAGAARLIRAVCTIEAMDRNGNVMIQDARGRMHTVGGVETEKLDNVRLGDTVVVVFTEALVL